MSTAVVQIGPHGGKIVGFANGKPVYLHEGAAPGGSHDHGQFPDGSPFAAAKAAGLQVGVHPTQHDLVQVAWKPGNAAAAAWLSAHPLPPEARQVATANAVIVRAPKSWAATAPADPVVELAKAHGIEAVDPATLKNPIAKWTESPRHPVTVAGGGAGELLGWALDNSLPRKKVYPPRLVVRLESGEVKSFPAADVAPVPGAQVNPPWHGSRARIWKSAQASATMKALLAEAAPGQGGKTRQQVIDALAAHGIASYPMGGFVRDAIQGKPSKDIDMSFNADWTEVIAAAQKEGLAASYPGPGGLVKLGKKSSDSPPLEGKAFMGHNADRHEIAPGPPSTGHSFADEAIYGDCAHGRLWYDPVNDVIIDPTGHGVEDTISKTFRIPVPEDQWESWVQGSPDKLWRWWKFKARGETTDEKTRQFIISKAKALFGKSEWTTPSMLQVRLGGVVGSGPAAQQKLDAFKAAVVDDMGEDFWKKHWLPVVPAGLKG